jgi:hypothetical protein
LTLDDALTRFANTLRGKQSFVDQMQDELETQSFREHKGNYTDMPTNITVVFNDENPYLGDNFAYEGFDPQRMPISPPNAMAPVHDMYRYDDGLRQSRRAWAPAPDPRRPYAEEGSRANFDHPGMRK